MTHVIDIFNVIIKGPNVFECVDVTHKDTLKEIRKYQQKIYVHKNMQLVIDSDKHVDTKVNHSYKHVGEMMILKYVMIREDDDNFPYVDDYDNIINRTVVVCKHNIFDFNINKVRDEFYDHITKKMNSISYLQIIGNYDYDMILLVSQYLQV